MLDQLREIDQEVVTRKEDKVTEYKEQLTEFDTVTNKLYTMKSAALNLSLSSNYLERTVKSSDETVATADSVVTGTTAQSWSLNVTQLAQKSSWLSTSGFGATTDSVYVPTLQQSKTAVSNTANYVTADDTMVIKFGPKSSPTATITVSVTAGMSLTDVVNAINSDSENVNGASTYVTAEDYVDGSGNHYLRVKSTAGGTGESDRVMISDQLANDTLVAPDKTLSYKVGSGSTVSVSVAADTSLSGLASLINNDKNNGGITASVINDGDASKPYHFSVVSKSTGEDGRITFVSQLADLPMTEKQGAGGASLNSQFTVDGVNYQRQTNTFSDAITGVTLTLKKAGSTSITVSDNTDKIKAWVKDLVTAYNDVVQEVKTKSAYDTETETFGILAHTTLRELPGTMQDLMTTGNTADKDGNIKTMFDLGLEFNRDGSITLNEKTLDSAFEKHASGVSAFLAGDTDRNIDGFADSVNDWIKMVTGTTGQIKGEKDAANARIKDLEQSIEKENARLDKKYELMKKQFIELDTYMNEMTSLSDYLKTTFDSMSNAWSSNKK